MVWHITPWKETSYHYRHLQWPSVHGDILCFFFFCTFLSSLFSHFLCSLSFRAQWTCLQTNWSSWVNTTMRKSGSWSAIRWDDTWFELNWTKTHTCQVWPACCGSVSADSGSTWRWVQRPCLSRRFLWSKPRKASALRRCGGSCLFLVQAAATVWDAVQTSTCHSLMNNKQPPTDLLQLPSSRSVSKSRVHLLHTWPRSGASTRTRVGWHAGSVLPKTNKVQT